MYSVCGVLGGVTGRGRSETQVAETGVIVGAAAQGPVKAAVGLADRRIVDAREATTHQAVLAELPILIAVGAEPVAAVVVPLIGEADGHAVLAEAPQLLDEPIVQLTLPLAAEERDNRLPALHELDAIPPVAIDGVGERDLFRVATVPPIFGQTDLFDRGFHSEGRQGGTLSAHWGSPFLARRACSSAFSVSSWASRSRSGRTVSLTSCSVKRGVMCCGQFQSKFSRRSRKMRSSFAL